jgi:opacity protein-like surface antigen
MLKWRLIVLGLLVVCSASTVFAQFGESDYGKFQVTPFAGYRFGGTIDLSQSNNPALDYIKINNDVNFGAMFDYTFWSSFQAEFMWNRERTSLGGHDPETNSMLYLTSMNFDTYQWSVAYNFLSPERKIRPFVVAGLGFSHYGAAPVDSESVLGFSNRFAYNIGGGAKYFFNDHWGVRAELRWIATHTTSGVATYCDPFFGCYPATVANKANQGALDVGVIYRFGKSSGY